MKAKKLSSLGKVRQLGIVVDDIHRAMKYWSSILGVGPFYHLEHAPAKELKFNGAPCDARLSLAFAQHGEFQIELVHPLDEVDSPFKAYQKTHGQGLQHLGYWPADFDVSYSEAISAGWKCIFSGVSPFDPEARFAYFDAGGPKGSPLVEIASTSAARERFFKLVADASVGWTGEGPVRIPNIAR